MPLIPPRGMSLEQAIPHVEENDRRRSGGTDQ